MRDMERKREYDRERQGRLYAEGRSYKQLHPENQQVCDDRRAGTLTRILSQTAAHARAAEGLMAALPIIRVTRAPSP
jgi:hypothetical protein